MLNDLFAAPTPPAGPPRITFICTGNICRSPLAEKLMRARLDELGQQALEVESAGLHALVGAPMDLHPAAIAARNGGNPSHIGRQVTEGLLRSSSVVLTMTREQRGELAQEFPFALKRTFTLVEFLRILQEVPDHVTPPAGMAGISLFDTAITASRYRGMIVMGPDDDIEDPYRRSEATHERVGNRINELVSTLASKLTPAAI